MKKPSASSKEIEFEINLKNKNELKLDNINNTNEKINKTNSSAAKNKKKSRLLSNGNIININNNNNIQLNNKKENHLIFENNFMKNIKFEEKKIDVYENIDSNDNRKRNISNYRNKSSSKNHNNNISNNNGKNDKKLESIESKKENIMKIPKVFQLKYNNLADKKSSSNNNTNQNATKTEVNSNICFISNANLNPNEASLKLKKSYTEFQDKKDNKLFKSHAPDNDIKLANVYSEAQYENENLNKQNPQEYIPNNFEDKLNEDNYDNMKILITDNINKTNINDLNINKKLSDVQSKRSQQTKKEQTPSVKLVPKINSLIKKKIDIIDNVPLVANSEKIYADNFQVNVVSNINKKEIKSNKENILLDSVDLSNNNQSVKSIRSKKIKYPVDVSSQSKNLLDAKSQNYNQTSTKLDNKKNDAPSIKSSIQSKMEIKTDSEFSYDKNNNHEEEEEEEFEESKEEYTEESDEDCSESYEKENSSNSEEVIITKKETPSNYKFTVYYSFIKLIFSFIH